MNPFFFPPYHFISLFIVAFFVNLPVSFSDDEPIFSNKAIFSACSKKFFCGGFTNISYPFWGYGRPSYCGHPSFKLYCEDETLEFKIESLQFRVLGINDINHTIHVVRKGFPCDGYSCPYLPEDFSFRFHSNVFNTSIPSNQNIKIGFDCNYGSYQYILDPSYYTSGEKLPVCNRTVVVPILKALGPQLQNRSTLLDDVLKEGFDVGYSAIGAPCAKCELSGGQCGYYTETSQPTCFCQDMEHDRCPTRPLPSPPLHVLKGTKKKKIALGLGTGIACVFLVACTIYLSKKTFWKRKKNDQLLVENFFKNYGSVAPKRYSYSDIKKITTSFKEKIGQGGYGEVYKGKLIDGRPVAVKLLNNTKGNGEDFINEVASISRTSHVNIVSLLGFFFDESKRALVYEFMANGSLEKFIYDHNTLQPESHLGWDVLYKIAVGVARGLQYLHRGCNTLILHLDIKPHNILLDQDFNPKLSDFGLAKQYSRDESIASMLNGRGTPGYTAPEMINRNFGRVSHKSDVYSYGMMVLEMVGKRKNIDVGVDHISEIYFPQWIYKRLELDEDLGLCGVVSEGDMEITKKMILVALWCIQSNPIDRPEMSRVEEMLEGKLELLSIPPKPYLCSPPRSPPAGLPRRD